MNAALLSLALLGSQPVMPISDRIPQFNVEALCKATSADDKAMGLAEPQSFADCVRDETAASQQLEGIWQANSASVRASCEGEATAGGSASYVDLLTCLQMAGGASSQSSAVPLRGGSKTRNKK